jgi:hypothetical protein
MFRGTYLLPRGGGSGAPKVMAPWAQHDSFLTSHKRESQIEPMTMFLGIVFGLWQVCFPHRGVIPAWTPEVTAQLFSHPAPGLAMAKGIKLRQVAQSLWKQYAIRHQATRSTLADRQSLLSLLMHARIVVCRIGLSTWIMSSHMQGCLHPRLSAKRQATAHHTTLQSTCSMPLPSSATTTAAMPPLFSQK